MPAVRQALLQLRAGSVTEDDLRVTRVVGREAISEPFRFDVEVEPVECEPLSLADLVGRPALLTMRRHDGVERLVHGVLGAAELAGVHAGGPRYRVRIVPRLALLAHTRDCRIFQELTVPDIVRKVLREEKVDHKLSLSGNYPQREYCVQYRESKLEFVSRLLEEEGILYFFEHGEDAHTMVLADSPGAFEDIHGDARVPFRDLAAGVQQYLDDERVTAVARSFRVRTGKVTMRDYDFQRPQLEISASTSATEDPTLEAYRYGLGYADAGALKRLAAVRLEEARVPVKLTEGEAHCLRLVPGACFELVDHPDPASNGTLQLLAVEHEASQDATAEVLGHTCRFTAQAKGTPLRPMRRSPRPAIPGSQTATVVGPAGEEIHTDEHGRIKLKFHWDRHGRRDDHATCFVRVVQDLAGPGWGGVRLPRVGQEVLVRFFDADPDRPLVMGAVYNGATPSPIQLPGDKTRSTLRSDSSKGGNGFNELRFEDAKGAEEVFLHAQKDERIAVENDKRQQVRANEALAVEKDRSRRVGQDQRLSVEKDDASLIEGDQTLTVEGTRETRILLAHSEEVKGSQAITVGMKSLVEVKAESATTVGAAAALSVGGAYVVNTGGILNIAVAGARLEEVGGARIALVGAAAELRVVKDASASVGGDDAVAVDGKLDAATGSDLEETIEGGAACSAKAPASFLGKSIELRAAQKLTIEVGGKVVLEARSAGQIAFSGQTITLDGDRVTTKGAQVKKSSG